MTLRGSHSLAARLAAVSGLQETLPMMHLLLRGIVTHQQSLLLLLLTNVETKTKVIVLGKERIEIHE